MERTMTEAMERAGRAAYELHSATANPSYDDMDDGDKAMMMAELRAAIAAYLADVPVSEGMVEALEAQFQHWKDDTGTNGPHIRAHAFVQTIGNQLAEELSNGR